MEEKEALQHHRSTSKKRRRRADTNWFVFPSSLPRSFGIGDRIFLRPKSRKEHGRLGIVLQLKENKRIDIQLDDGGKKEVAPKRLLPVIDSPKNDNSDDDGGNQRQQQKQRKIIVTSETTTYRSLAASQLTKNDHVLEIGCSTGEASVTLIRYSASWIGFDTSDKIIAQCRCRIENDLNHNHAKNNKNPKSDLSQKIFKIDAITNPHSAREILANSPPSVVFIDIGGNRDLEGVLRMIAWVLKEIPSSRLIVVKSRELVKNIIDDYLTGSKQNESKDETVFTVSGGGAILDGSLWFEQKLLQVSRKIPTHPLQAPLRYAPGSDTPICRYHNYHVDGCKRYSNTNSSCCYDHDFCHLCLKKGHIARKCSLLTEMSTITQQ